MKRNKFSLSHTKLTSFTMGELVPIGLFEVLPGDTVQQVTSMLVRASPLLAPIFHQVQMRVHHWFVPNRLIWEDWEDFITAGPDGMDDSVYPTINLTYAAGSPATGSNTVGSLADYLGVPPAINNLVTSALPFRAYAAVYNEFYRDQDLVTPVGLSLASGADSTTSTALQHIAWEKDRYTASRPWEQKGPAVTIPLGTTAPVHGVAIRSNAGAAVTTYAGTGVDAAGDWAAGQPAWASTQADILLRAQSAAAPSSGNRPQVFADLNNASAITVTLLREALALQRFEEARARYGSRYTEYLRYLGVTPDDARLQRPEYLGGGQNPLQFSEVLATATTDDATVGDLKGHGIGATRSNRYRRFIPEHGWVLTLASVRPKTMYMQGLPRHWNRRTREDFWNPEFEHIGQQEVQNKEVYAKHASPDGTFGYSDRYAEYRSLEDGVSGEFRTTMLDYWHLARDFSSDPALNASFVNCVPTDRVFVDQTGDDTLYVSVRHSIQARRMLSRSAQSFIF